MIPLRNPLTWLALVAGLTLSSADTASGADRPNIIFILSDDLGYGDVKCLNPQGKIATPNLDRLAAGGMIFTDGHTSSSVCTPTRYGVMTGRYNWRTKLQNGVLGGLSPRLIEPDRLTVAAFLKQQGYHTACVGKWHLGMDWARTGPVSELTIESREQAFNVDFTKPVKNGPLAVGFDYYFGISASLDMVPYTFIENDRVAALPTEDRKLDMMTGRENWFTRQGPAAPGFTGYEVLPTLTDKAIAYVEQRATDARAGRPFFLYLPYASPHTPILPNKSWQGKSGLNPYADFVMEHDAEVGRLLSALDRLGLTENTLIVFTSDNGCSPSAKFEELLPQGHNPSHVFRGHKADIFDGGHRVPFIVRWPARVKAGTTSDQLVCLTDFMATCAAILGRKLPPNAAEDSISFLPALRGQPAGGGREAVVHHSINGSFAIRQGRWKLNLCPGSGGWSEPRPGRTDTSKLPLVQLYDLSQDIGETRNLASAEPEVVTRLTKLLEQYVADGRSTPGPRQTNAVPVDVWKAAKDAHKPLAAKKQKKAK
jgi:arylsulfatase A-like enzyme